MADKYLIDANVFIQAKNLYYRFDFCGGFWDWISQAHAAGLVYSIKKVKAELLNGNDDDKAKIWAQQLPDTFFLDDETDLGVMKNYGKVMQWTADHKTYTAQAKQEFAKPTEADAFLISAAMHHQYRIVSQEESNPDRKNRILIPNAADAQGVKSIFVYDMLSKNAHTNFHLKI